MGRQFPYFSLTFPASPNSLRIPGFLVGRHFGCLVTLVIIRKVTNVRHIGVLKLNIKAWCLQVTRFKESQDSKLRDEALLNVVREELSLRGNNLFTKQEDA